MRSWNALILIVAGLGLGGCATIDPQPQWEQLEAISEERTEAPLIWEQSEADWTTVRTEIERLLANGLTRQDAVKIALLNNGRLQATFEEIGMAQADLVQASLFTNPTFAILPVLPFSSGNSAATFVAWLSDLWTVPLRKKVFSTQSEATIQRVGAAVVDTARWNPGTWRFHCHILHHIVNQMADTPFGVRAPEGMFTHLHVIPKDPNYNPKNPNAPWQPPNREEVG